MQIFAILVKADSDYNTSSMKARVLKYFKDEKIYCFKTNIEAIDEVMTSTHFKQTHLSYNSYISHDAIKNIVFDSTGGLFFIKVPDENDAKKITNELVMNLNCTVLYKLFDNEYFQPVSEKYKKTISYVHMKVVDNQSSYYSTIHYLFNGVADFNSLGKLRHDELCDKIKKLPNYTGGSVDFIALFIKLVYEFQNDISDY
ncbi:hypothetical protein XaC1_418 [Xanthomonas phage XaC1]|nr:hypothetical protein XaC1_418 [Xanthomonas phage XaC1]